MSSKSPKVEQLRAELQAEEARLEALLAPARATYERLMNDPALIEARKTIKQVSALLAPVKNELAALARAGGARGIQVEPGSYTTT